MTESRIVSAKKKYCKKNTSALNKSMLMPLANAAFAMQSNSLSNITLQNVLPSISTLVPQFRCRDCNKLLATDDNVHYCNECNEPVCILHVVTCAGEDGDADCDVSWCRTHAMRKENHCLYSDCIPSAAGSYHSGMNYGTMCETHTYSCTACPVMACSAHIGDWSLCKMNEHLICSACTLECACGNSSSCCLCENRPCGSKEPWTCELCLNVRHDENE